MIFNIGSALFLALIIGSGSSSSAVDSFNLRGLGGCNRCSTRNPCKKGGKQFYFKHCNEKRFIQCDESGGCHTQKCPKGMVWHQGKLTCVHEYDGAGGSCCEDSNPCTPKNINDDKLYHEHCKDHDKFLQCSAAGQCFEMPCPPGTVWSQHKKTCIHAH